MTSICADEQRIARAALTYLVEPADPVAGAFLAVHPPTELLAAIRTGWSRDSAPGGELSLLGGLAGDRAGTAIARAIDRWRARLPDLPGDKTLAALAGADSAIRLACPGDPEWPGCLDDLGHARPYALWIRGSGDLRDAAERAISVVGSRACTGYGAHVAGVLAGELAERGWTVVSGGAYGIDAAAHRAALHAGGQTVAVLACGVDFAYPAGHAVMLDEVASSGVIVSEWPPGSRPTRLRFLVRNRVIAALGRATVVVEAGRCSGALNTARHSADLGRTVMAVPGPVTAEQSAGCHLLIRAGAHLVRDAADVTEAMGM